MEISEKQLSDIVASAVRAGVAHALSTQSVPVPAPAPAFAWNVPTAAPASAPASGSWAELSDAIVACGHRISYSGLHRAAVALGLVAPLSAAASGFAGRRGGQLVKRLSLAAQPFVCAANGGAYSDKALATWGLTVGDGFALRALPIRELAI